MRNGWIFCYGGYMEIDKKLKEPKTFDEQIKILEDRGMIIENKDEAIRVLGITNYYRLTAYALQFKYGDKYKGSPSFDYIYKLYKFDKKLRHMLLEIIESVEVSLRTYMAYNLSLKYGTEAHTNVEIFKNIDLYRGYVDYDGNVHKGLVDEIKLEISKNRKEPFVKHHIKNYEGHFPIWVIVEIFSFGMLSRTYSNLNLQDQKEISRGCFNINHELLESWLNNLSYIRNICAHYGRLYNKKMSITPKIHNKYKKYQLDLNKLFVSILVIKELTKFKLEWDTFKIRLEALLEENKDIVDLNLIGFPKNWREILDI